MRVMITASRPSHCLKWPPLLPHIHTQEWWFTFFLLHVLLFSRPFTCSPSQGLMIENTPPPLAQTPLSVVCSLHTSCARSPSFHSLSLLVRNCCTGVTGEAPRLSLLSASVLASPDDHRLRATVVAPTWSWPLCVNVSIILCFIIQGLVCLLVCMTNLTPTGSLGSMPPWVRKATRWFCTLSACTWSLCWLKNCVVHIAWEHWEILPNIPSRAATKMVEAEDIVSMWPPGPSAVDGEVSLPLALRSENEKACSHLSWVTQ